MEIRTTKQPRCSKEQAGEAGKALSTKGKFGQMVIRALKLGLRFALLRPATWRLLTVHLPDVAEKANLFWKSVVSFFADLL